MRLLRTFVIAGVLLAGFVGILAGFLLIRLAWPSAPADARAVAFVNGMSISADDLEVRLAQILPAASYHGNVDPERLIALRRLALDELVLDELIYREAVAQGQHASDAAVDAEVAAVKQRFGDDVQFDAALRENGLTRRTFRERTARMVLVREVRHAREKQVITDADIAAYYRANAGKFQRPERVHLLEILVRVDPADLSSARAAERKARRILGRVRAGEEFGALARAMSEDEYRVKDGDMGFVHRGRLDAEFEEAVFAAVPGQYQIARSLYGFEVFFVADRQPAAQLSLEDARSVIGERLERRRREEALRAWHTRLIARARIEIRDPVLRRAQPAELVADPLLAGGRPRSSALSGSQQ